MAEFVLDLALQIDVNNRQIAMFNIVINRFIITVDSSSAIKEFDSLAKTEIYGKIECM